jgi:hypothetical protein
MDNLMTANLNAGSLRIRNRVDSEPVGSIPSADGKPQNYADMHFHGKILDRRLFRK